MDGALYDNPEFLERYIQFPRQQLGLAGAPEWPDLRRLLPPLDDTSILDLGCGFGWFSRWAADQGARRVVGIDVSDRMLERASADTQTTAVEYRRGDLAELALGDERFDVAFSSLAFHYLSDVAELFRTVHTALRPGGWLVFSAEHPVMTAPTTLNAIEHGGREVWPLDRYCDEGPRLRTWLVDGVEKYHRTVGTWVNSVLGAGFDLRQLIEWGPSDDQVVANPAWSIEQHRPPFLLLSAQARGQ